ncbi:hypothetical protein ACFYUM_34785 [Streptomyces fimicarius]|uniref:hypothetical protein n=1 Tax=Streptomyces griseus TaxID=1911 RepID=UPI00368A5233
MKDLEGIGAVASAGVAAVGIVATLLLGRWALRGAQDAAHAGQAQAAATYQAALDAVQAQSQSDHQQWRRGIQREAYAAFLQSVLSYTDGARDDLRRASGMEETRACIAVMRALETDMSQRAWVVRLEGPDEVASAAMTLQTSAKILVIIEENHARRTAAMTDLNLRNRTHPQEVTRIWELIPVARSFWRSIGTPEDTSTAVLAELRDLFTACELSPGLISTLCEPHEPASGDHPSFDEASRDFIRAAREVLHSEGLPAV